MTSNQNPVHASLHALSVDRTGLEPSVERLGNGCPVALFRDPSFDILRLDFVFEAGSAYQPRPLVASAALQLFSEGTRHRSAQAVADFLDQRGIVVSKDTDMVSSCVTVYTLKRYATELLPLLKELLTEPAFDAVEFERFRDKKRQQLREGLQKTPNVAQALFYETLYGSAHPMGRHAVPDDADRLSLEEVRRFFARRFDLGQARMTLSGNFDDATWHCFADTFGTATGQAEPLDWLSPEALAALPKPAAVRRQALDGAVQSTLRVGRLLPWRWDDPRYCDFQVLNTLLGGYFGSRLMSNIREEKGYTYGIYSQCRLSRGSTAFCITADVGGDVTDAALDEVYAEVQRLCDEPVAEEELTLVKNYMIGDFIRSIDGMLERAERYRSMQAACLSERFTEQLLQAIDTVTPDRLQAVANEVLQRKELSEIVVGVTQTTEG